MVADKGLVRHGLRGAHGHTDAVLVGCLRVGRERRSEEQGAK